MCSEMIKQMAKELVCADCGEQATEGSMKHPFCRACFMERFGGDYNKYYEFLKRTHG